MLRCIHCEYSKESVWFAYQLQSTFKKKLGFESRGVKFANFQPVLRETAKFYPSVLLEMGFMINTDEAGYFGVKVPDYFLRPKNIRAMALAILMGLYDYKKTGI